MIELVCSYIIPAAYAVLPPAMQSPHASALILAIGLQESGFVHRRQIHGPARGFPMFEAVGVAGVLTHARTAGPIRTALQRLGYRAPYESADLLTAIEHNDVLAVAFARCLLWTSPMAMPEPSQAAAALAIYLQTWRPGKPRPLDWASNYKEAWRLVDADL